MSIEIRGLTHIYMPGTPFETRALDDVSLTIRDGDFVGVIGHTGSGKSTLIAHLNALIRPEPGHVFVGGVDVGERGQSLIVTHSMDDAARFCDRLIVLDHGRVAFDAAPGEVFRHEEELRQMGLDVPECVKLVKALKARGMDLGEGLYRMEDVRAAILREVGKC